MKFTVDRKTWARGGRYTRLANEDGTKCCLGFLGEACGIPLSQLEMAQNPVDQETDEDSIKGLWPAGTFSSSIYMHSDAIRTAIRANDFEALSESDREWAITKALATIGIEVEFVG